VLDRRTLLSSIAACAAVTAAAAVSRAATMPGREGPTSAVPTYQRVDLTSELQRLQPRALLDVSTSLPLVALTFDDGPDPRYTPYVLDALASTDATATFFLIGANAVAYPSSSDGYLPRGTASGTTRSHTPTWYLRRQQPCSRRSIAPNMPSPCGWSTPQTLSPTARLDQSGSRCAQRRTPIHHGLLDDVPGEVRRLRDGVGHGTASTRRRPTREHHLGPRRWPRGGLDRSP